MTWLAQMFHQGGPSMYWIEYLAAPAVIIAVIHIVRPQAWARWVTLAAIALVLAAGAYGMLQGRHMTDAAVDFTDHDDPNAPGAVTAADREEMRAEGYQEAMRPIQFAGIVAGALAVLFAIGELRRRAIAGRGSGRSAAGA